LREARAFSFLHVSLINANLHKNGAAHCLLKMLETMKVLWHRRKSGAFTLVELLTVIAIIGILSALLLPGLTKAKARAKRIECVNDLKELGTAFHLFAHDHQGKFPMQTPMSEGGSFEFVQSGYRVNGEFYFSYRHFQTLARELTLPKILVCPTDLGRQPARTFAALQNSNISYFVGVNADYDQPQSILAGDRNITNDFIPSSTIVRGTYGLRWTRELHFFKGNVLFADTHVEEFNDARFNLSANSAAIPVFFLPTVRPVSSSLPALTANNGPATPTSARDGKQPVPLTNAPSKNNNPDQPTNSLPPQSDPARTSASTRIAHVNSSHFSVIEINARETNAVALPGDAKPATAPAAIEPEDSPLLWLSGAAGALVAKAGWWLLLLLLLLIAIRLYLYARRRMREQRKRMMD
jgi:prepilin-type N-terminal cleavage/methylation domain-containing protein/prepilin-type processing-associated H-X9-DG protein